MSGEWLTATWLRMKALVKRRKLDRDLEEELRFHLAMREEKNRAAGVAEDEVHAAARRRFGNVTLMKEVCREMWTFASLETLWQDVRYGARMLRKNPTVTVIGVVTLALGIGANTVIFSVVNAVLYRKPPVRDPDRVMMVSSKNPANVSDANRNPVSAPDYLDWRAQSTSFSGMAAAEFDSFTISGGTNPDRAAGARVSPDFFNVLGVEPAIGRTFFAGEDQAGHDHVVVLSDELWKGKFGGDAQVLGRLVKLNGDEYTVVGVMPASFRMSTFLAKLWVPLVVSHANLGATGRGDRFLQVFARLRPGIDERQARSEMATIAQRIAQAYPDTNRGWGASVMTVQQYTIEDVNAGPALAFLMAAVGFVLLIACANIANLLLARNSARQREFSIRAVLGAGRIRLARQLLTECVLLSLTGACLGMLFAYWGLHAILSQFNWNEDALAMAKEVTIDAHVLAFTIAISVMAALLFGIAPSLRFSRGGAAGSLKGDSRGTTAGRERHRLQRLLVIGQLALSLFLLVGASLFAEGFVEEIRASAGFNPDHVLTALVPLRGLEYLHPQGQKQFFQNALQRLASLPGVQSVAASSYLPFGFPEPVPFLLENQPAAKPGEQPSCSHFQVTPGYFAMTQIPLFQGREFDSSDNADSMPVAIVNEAFARKYFPGRSAIGGHIRIDPESRAAAKWSEIVGVVGNVNEFMGQTAPRPQVFEPFLAQPAATMYFLVRTRTDPSSFADSLRHAIWAVDSGQAITDVKTMQRVIFDSGTGDNVMTEMMGSFAGMALLLAAIGIYGVLSYLVGQRTHELGIRLALGAMPSELLRLVIRNGMGLVVTGTLAGSLFSLALPKLVAATFEGFHFHSALVLGLAPVVIVVAGLAACFVPARRAMRVDPMVALRYE